MTLFSALPFAAAILSSLLGVASLLRKKPSLAACCFFAGMVIFGIDSVFTGLSLRATTLQDVLRWLTFALVAKSLLPAAWLCFSLTYSRGDYRASLTRAGVPLAMLSLLPVALSVGFRDQLFQVVPADPAGDALLLRLGVAAKALNVALLLAFAFALMNLEQTFRAAVGTMRWRVKFVTLGLAVVFGGHLYVRSQAILFPTYDIALSAVESSALLIGCLFLALAYARTGFAEADVYPSRAVLRSSLTVLIVGGYLVIVGILAQVVRRFGGAQSFQVEAFVVLLGMAGLGVLLLSDRFRQRMQTFVARHFRRAQHDSVRTWTLLSQRLARVKDETGLCAVSARLVSETLDVLSATVWLLNEEKGQLGPGASTARQSSEAIGGASSDAASSAVAAGLQARSSPFDLETVNEAWAEEWRRLNPSVFPNGGHRWCVPLRAGDQCLGAFVLADRVNAAPYTLEEMELVRCIADQTTSVLLNLRLANAVALAKELEAFRAMSAFFVHDLKNAAASLNLMLKNLPLHFDDPAFRDDALRGIGNTARRIDEMIARLSALRQRPEVRKGELGLNQLVNDVADGMSETPDVELTRELQPLPLIQADREQLRSVITNLLLNACDAVGPGGGRIQVRTEHHEGRVVLSVSDNGCGMGPEFVKRSLFRPFQSTKKNGLGIGMFQIRMVVEAHGGGIQVESEVGRGTTIRVTLPVRDTT
jgi:putative PEP-CTERM system histidine kinase